MKLLKFSTTLLVLQLVLSSALFAQNANSILKKASEQHSKMVEKVEDMQITMRPDGGIGGFDKMVTYYKKENVDGKPVFKTYTKFEGGMGELANHTTATSTQSMDMFAFGANMYESLKDVAKFDGVETVDGEKTNVLFVSDMSSFMKEAWGQFQSEESDARVKDVRIYVDDKKHVVRKVTMNAEMSQDGMKRDMEMMFLMSDYRQVGPVFQPFSTKTVMQNPMSPEERAELTKQREEIEAMLESLPENQRGAVEGMLKQLGGEKIEITMIVEDLKVNEGVPAEYFE